MEESTRSFFDFCQEIKNPNGRSRTLEENKLLILALRAYLRRKVESMNRTLGSFRLKAIRDYLISFDKYVCAIENGNQDGLDFENGPRCRQIRIPPQTDNRLSCKSHQEKVD